MPRQDDHISYSAEVGRGKIELPVAAYAEYEEGAMSTHITTTDTDTLPYHLLDSEARRHILAELAENPLCTVNDIVETVVSQPDILEGDRVRLHLHHIDLPKLFDAGLVDYDWHSGDIVRTGDAITFERLYAEATSDAPSG